MFSNVRFFLRETDRLGVGEGQIEKGSHRIRNKTSKGQVSPIHINLIT